VADDVHAEGLEAFQIKSLRVLRGGLDDRLELVVVLEAVGVLAVSPVGRPPRRLDVSGLPRLGPKRLEESRPVKRPRALLEVVRLDNEAAPLGPEVLEGKDDLLEIHRTLL
jgi:hypothetical protein